MSTSPSPSKENATTSNSTTASESALSSNPTSIPSIKTTEDIIVMDTPEMKSESNCPKLSILDLPLECQSEILKHVGRGSNNDLIATSLVSKHFKNLAAEQLYRTFQIGFPGEDDPADDLPIDILAGGLETYATSDYNYAKYLKTITLESLLGGPRGEDSYRRYLYKHSCGKFMGILLLMTLRKATALETFNWDIRVELSREVFKQLHKIEALKHLRLRMQAGKSMYIPPSALNEPKTTSPTLPNASGISHTPYSSHPTNAAKPWSDTRNTLPTTGPPTISGFKNLESLAILDMDTLDYVPEVKECIEKSSSTLKSLKLSLSDALASKSRKPPPDIPSDEDDESDEDEIGQYTPPPPDPYSPTKALAALAEKKIQETILGDLFGIEAPPPKVEPSPKSYAAAPPPKADEEAEPKPEDTREIKLMRKLPKLAARIMAAHAPGTDSDDVGKEIIALIEKASLKFINSTEEGKKSADKKDEEKKDEEKKDEKKEEQDAEPSSGNVQTENADGESPDQPSLFDDSKPTTEKSTEPKDSSPEDIDIEEPEVQEGTPDNEAGNASNVESESEAQSEPKSTALFGSPENGKLSVDTVSDDVTKGFPSSAEMSAYVRKTRGLTLETLAIYLIPLKPSVLLKAIDIRVLQNITLLNVGPQTLFWNLVAKENRTTPLPLCKIYTDNVTAPFLACVAQLEKVIDLFLLERSQRTRVESTAAKTTVTIEQIRKLVLKKHAPTLRALMIHNDETHDWDLNVKSAILLCRKAKKLEELAVVFDVVTMHVLHQNLSGLQSLIALHVIEFRAEDTCMWVIKEFRRFTMDNVAHNPQSKLTYLGLERSVEKLMRTKAKETKEKKEKAKGKKKEMSIQALADMILGSGSAGGLGGSANVSANAGIGGNVGGLGPDGLNINVDEAVDWDSESSDEEEDGDGEGDGEEGPGPGGIRVDCLEGKFSDVKGVRIFEKDVIYARL